MRVIVFFDLPQISSGEKKEYRKFVKNLKEEGFYMLQESVYVKLAINSQVSDSIKNHIKTFLPKNGSVMVLSVTEKQFSSIEIMLGENKTDTINDTSRLTVL